MDQLNQTKTKPQESPSNHKFIINQLYFKHNNNNNNN